MLDGDFELYSQFIRGDVTQQLDTAVHHAAKSSASSCALVIGEVCMMQLRGCTT